MRHQFTRKARRGYETHLRTNLVAYLSLFVALGGTSYAAAKLPTNSVGASQIKQNAVRSGEVKDRSLLARDFRPGQLPAGEKGEKGEKGEPGPQGATGAVDTSAFYDKTTSDARFLEVRSLDFNAPLGTAKGFNFGTIHLDVTCNTTTGAQLLVKGSSTTPAIVSSTYTSSSRGGGSTSPLAGRQGLSTTSENLFFADNNTQKEGVFLFRTPGKVITMTFHASATTLNNACELHATVTEPHGPPLN